MSILNMTFIFLLSACTLFPEKLENKDAQKLLAAVRLTGEGRGRLTLGQNQYVFSFESVLKEDFDWILAVSIPLQGEEAMIFKDLRKKNVTDSDTESFEVRIANEFHALNIDRVVPPEVFLRELRSLVRFNLARHWGGEFSCIKQQAQLECEFESEKFLVMTEKDQLNISKSLGNGKHILLEAKVLKDQKFERTDFKLSLTDQQPSVMSLELFWQE